MQHYLQSAPLVLLAKVITINAASRARVPAAARRRGAPERPPACVQSSLRGASKVAVGTPGETATSGRLRRPGRSRKSRTPYAETALQRQSGSLGCVEALKEVRDRRGAGKDIFMALASPDPLKISHECDPRGLFQQRELCTPVGKPVQTRALINERFGTAAAAAAARAASLSGRL